MTLLRDIQNSAIDSSSSLSNLLRKCKVLAARLQNEELKKWVDSELDGYQTRDEVPKYRIIECVAKGNLGGPFGAEMKNITIPSFCLPEKFRDWTKCVYFSESISSLEELVKGKGDCLCEWPGELIAAVADKIYRGYRI